MSQKNHFIARTGLTMGLFPIGVTFLYFAALLVSIPGVAWPILFCQSVLLGPINIIFQSLRYLSFDFQLSGDFPPLLFIGSFFFWLIIGSACGVILYGMWKNNLERLNFSVKNLFLVIVLQLVLGYIFTHAFARIFNLIFFN